MNKSSFLTACLVIYLVLNTASCTQQEEGIALGLIERERVAHTATVSEIITALPFKEGDSVKQGDVLVQLNDQLQQAIVAQRQAEVQAARANLDKLLNGARPEDIAVAQANVEQYRAALKLSNSEYKRQTNLRNTGLASQAQLEEVIARRDADQARLNSALEDLKRLTNGTREEDLRMAQAELDAHLAILRSAEKKLSDLSITATRDGILDSYPWNLGERVSIETVVAIVIAGPPYARVYIPETHRVNMKTGDTFQITVDGIESPIQVRLRQIANDPAFTPYYGLSQSERARLVYLAEFDFVDSEYFSLPSGLPVELKLMD